MSTFALIAFAALVIILIVFNWPAAKHWMKNGPRGNTAQWLNFALIMLAVAAFVYLLVIFAKGG